MSDQKKTWNNVSKKRKKKRPFKNKRQMNETSGKWRDSRRDHSSTPTSLNSKHDFPSLTNNKFSTFNKPSRMNTYNALAWRKNLDSNNDTPTIYNKAKSGAIVLNSYPSFSDSPEFPLFQ